MIEFQDVTVCYEPQRRHPVNALDGINLEIEAGDWVFLVGPSGAGKSTLLKLLYAGVKATSGKVLVDGRDLTQLKPGEVPLLRRRIGIVFQNFQLLAQKTAFENVAFALQVIGTPQAQIVREVPRALETVGLPHRAHALPHELSGGEQQRIAIARAIVNDPPVLLADEPTGNLDPKTGWEIAEVLQRINEDRGTTVVMCTHDRFLVNHLRRRVVRLVNGRIVSDEANGIYHADDDDLRDRPAAPSTPAQSTLAPSTPPQETVPENSARESTLPPVYNDQPSNGGAVHWKEVKTKPAEDSDGAFTQAALHNDAPLGSEENPIVRY
jgi:cell division transport system ATP-binding protein